MSITPVREALLRLVSVNALSVAPAQAFTVPEVGETSIRAKSIGSATNWN